MSGTNPLDPTIQNERQRAIDQAYADDGRHDPAHPRHAIYTGLIEQQTQQAVEHTEGEVAQ